MNRASSESHVLCSSKTDIRSSGWNVSQEEDKAMLEFMNGNKDCRVWAWSFRFEGQGQKNGVKVER